jgi:alpha-mannosidase
MFEPGQTVTETVSVNETSDRVILENNLVRVELLWDGTLDSMFDKRVQREAIEHGQSGNRLVYFEDEPNNWDAWDVDIFHLEKRSVCPPAHTVRVIERGPLRAAVEILADLSATSRLRQVVTLTAISPRLNFQTEVEWHERHQFLKVEFPLNLRAQQATFETQFGHLQRPTHFNTSWDMARFEVVAHHWADVSDPDFGVALLNDSKYGYAVHGNVMRLSLLRSSTAPDPEADQGTHLFSYALLPHPGGPQLSGVIEEGYAFNVPMTVAPSQAEPGEVSYFTSDNPAVIIETVKKAEDSRAVIVRLYEAHGTHAKTRLSSPLTVKRATVCNLLEEDLVEEGSTAPLDWSQNGAGLSFRPFEIKTVKLQL